MTGWIVRCPGCGHAAPWTPVPVPVVVRCPLCDTEARIRPIPRPKF